MGTVFSELIHFQDIHVRQRTHQKTTTSQEEKCLKENHTVLSNKNIECLDVNFVYSLIFHQSSDALQILVFAFNFFFLYFVELKSPLIFANIYLLPTVNCETRSACKAAVNRVLLSWDAISPVNMDSASHSMWKICQINIVKLQIYPPVTFSCISQEQQGPPRSKGEVQKYLSDLQML